MIGDMRALEDERDPVRRRNLLMRLLGGDKEEIFEVLKDMKDFARLVAMDPIWVTKAREETWIENSNEIPLDDFHDAIFCLECEAGLVHWGTVNRRDSVDLIFDFDLEEWVPGGRDNLGENILVAECSFCGDAHHIRFRG